VFLLCGLGLALLQVVRSKFLKCVISSTHFKNSPANVLNEAFDKNRDKKLREKIEGRLVSLFSSAVGQKLNLSWVGHCVGRFSVYHGGNWVCPVKNCTVIVKFARSSYHWL